MTNYYIKRPVSDGLRNGKFKMTDVDILNAFFDGEWCDTSDICRLLDISFAEGLRKFDFARTAEWNPAPLEGQKIATKFRIKKD